ncbi:hypothetical protein ACIQ64_33625 [Streptomyces sp. NPDC094473]|uniref:hypothetical protein n=1 Tax=unclassified Streptomyces TaxID=2593676 RepID=UPI0037F72C34
MSLRPTLRTAVLAAVGLGAVLLPSSVAAADDSPTPVPAERTESPTPAPGTAQPAESATPTPAPAEPTEAATPVPAESVPAGTMPRGGVDAGERPAEGSGVTALYGSAAGAALLAGGGVLVLRRRSAAQRNS